jgi:hypothetical protein
MPGERRGGRTRATPNRRTILADRMMVVLAGCAMPSPKRCLSKLVNDVELPADIRITIAQKAFPGHTGGVRSQRRKPRATEALRAASPPGETMSRPALEALFCIVSDASASAKSRRKAAMKLATYFLPMKPVNKRWRFTADECGFAINAEVAREYRAIDFELRDLERHPNRDFPEIAQMIGKLQARIGAIRERLQCPSPTRYGHKEICEDWIRLAALARKREDGIALCADEDAEEAHRKARFDCYVRGPEQTERRYRKNLEDADLCYRKGRFFKDMMTPPLSRKQRRDLALLRWLYPPRKSQSDVLEIQADDALWIRYPFCTEEPAADGNWYPHDSKLRPASADEPEFIEYADVPPFCIYTPGQPPIFTSEPPINSSSDQSEPTQS